MLTSGDFTDMFVNYNVNYPQGLDYYIDEGVIIDIKPYFDTYAQDYAKIVAEEDNIRKAVTTDSGYVPLFRTINTSIQPTYMGFTTNQYYLDSCGITELPETVEAFGNMLAAFSEAGFGSNGQLYTSGGSNGMDSIIMSAFDAGSGYLNINGKAVYSPTTDNYKNYLATMADWYSKGYIDRDFLTRVHYYVDIGVYMSGEVAVYPTAYTFMPVIDGAWAANEGWETVALPNIRAVEGTGAVIATASTLTRMSGLAVTTACEHPELAVQWANYLYTEEGALCINYGIEGESFEFVDGKPMLTEFIYANPDGLSQNSLLCKYAGATMLPPSL